MDIHIQRALAYLEEAKREVVLNPTLAEMHILFAIERIRKVHGEETLAEAATKLEGNSELFQIIGGALAP